MANYWAEHDIYEQFKKEKIQTALKIIPNVPVEQYPIDETSKITEGDMYSTFKDWFSQNYGSLKTPDKPLFVSEMSIRLGCKPIKRAWYGIKLIVNCDI